MSDQENKSQQIKDLLVFLWFLKGFAIKINQPHFISKWGCGLGFKEQKLFTTESIDAGPAIGDAAKVEYADFHVGWE